MFADIEALKAAMGSSKASESAKAYSKSKASMNTYLDSKLTARFSSDFNSFEIYEEEGNVYVKQ